MIEEVLESARPLRWWSDQSDTILDTTDPINIKPQDLRPLVEEVTALVEDILWLNKSSRVHSRMHLLLDWRRRARLKGLQARMEALRKQFDDMMKS